MRPEIDYVYNKLKRLRFDFNSSDFKGFRSEYRYEPTLDRYVRKDDNDLFIAKDTFKPLEEELDYADNCHNLEEQIGCPLEVVIKALKDGIYTLDLPREDLIKQVDLKLSNRETEWYLINMIMVVNLKDYKKTWWLKEDKSE